MPLNSELPWRKGTRSGGGGCVEATPVTRAQRDQLRTDRPRPGLAFELYAAELHKNRPVSGFNSYI